MHDNDTKPQRVAGLATLSPDFNTDSDPDLADDSDADNPNATPKPLAGRW
jgi:hypothetical protein